MAVWHPRRRLFAASLALSAAPFAGAALAACGGPPGGTGGAAAAQPIPRGALVANPAKDEWPQQFWTAPASVQEAYRYALSHPDVLQYFPCFCGCVNDGHRSNRDCYIRQERPDGTFVLEPMSFG